jgi:rod shape determining protein RodA
MYNKKPVIARGVDWATVWLYILLVLFGLVCIFSVEYRGEEDVIGNIFGFQKNYSKQLYYLIFCGVLGIFILLTDSKFFTATPNLFYVIGVLLMLATFLVGKTVNGSKSWIPLGFMNLQPVEMMKVFTALALSKYLCIPDTEMSRTRTQLIAAAISFLPAFFSIMQNETGLALVYFSFLMPMYREGLPPVYLIAGAFLAILLVVTLLFPPLQLFIGITLIALFITYFLRKKIERKRSILLVIIVSWAVSTTFSSLAVPFLFRNVFQKYQSDRIFSLVGRDNPYVKEGSIQEQSTEKTKKSKGSRENYNVKQSKIAIGSGGFMGKGFMKGTQTQGDFVPEQHTDFIFTSVGENFGFIGSTLLMILYLLLLLRIIMIAERQRSVFSRVYAYSVAAIFFFHISINICMTIGLAPVIGITLPLLSYGGSSLLTFTLLIFILLKLDSDRQMILR